MTGISNRFGAKATSLLKWAISFSLTGRLTVAKSNVVDIQKGQGSNQETSRINLLCSVQNLLPKGVGGMPSLFWANGPGPGRSSEGEKGI